MGLPAPAVDPRAAGRPLHETLFVVYVFLLPIQVPRLATSPVAVFVGDAFLVAAMLAGLVAALRRRLRLSGSRLALAFAVYLGATLPSVALSDDPRRSALKWVVEACYLAVALAALHVAGSMAALRRLALAWLGGTAVTVAVALLTVGLFHSGVRHPWLDATQSGFGSLPPGHYLRPAALLHRGLPNSLCHYLSLSLLLVLMSAWLGWIGTRVAWLLGAATGVTVLLTLSPGIGGALLGVGCWLGWTWQASGKKRLALTAYALGAGAAVVFLLAILVSPVQSGRGGVEVPYLGWRIEPSPRVLCWRSAWQTFVDHPWLGRGVGLQTPCPDYWTASGALVRLADAHNTYLSLASTKGTAGVLAFGLVVGTLLRRSIPLPAPGSPAAMVVATLTIGVAQALLYQGLSGSYEFIRHLWPMIGLLSAAQDARACKSSPAG